MCKTGRMFKTHLVGAVQYYDDILPDMQSGCQSLQSCFTRN